MGVTIHDVAAEAGVSPSTVSNVLNGRSHRMLPQTRERVEQAIARLGYRPNGPARQLRTGRSQTVGLVVPSVANPFWGTFARHLEAVALVAGYRVLLCNSARDPDRERDYLEELWADGVWGSWSVRRCRRWRTCCRSWSAVSHWSPSTAPPRWATCPRW
jgi:DNA-binding LacI/PurR family transcriptional regulator